MFRYVSAALAVFAFLTLIALKPFTTVDTGHRGIQTTFGKVNSEVLSEGLYFFNPLTSAIHEVDVRTQTWSTDTTCYTKDIQTAKLNFTLNYNLEPNAAAEIYKTVGTNWSATLLPQVVQGTLKDIIGKWDAVDLIANRGKANTAIQDAITTALADKHIIVTKFEITNIDYNDEFEKAVEAKVNAVQHAAEAQNKTVQVKEEANQRVIAAKADAEAMQIKSNALSQNQNLVAYEAVQKWNGVLPTMITGTTPLQLLNGSK